MIGIYRKKINSSMSVYQEWSKNLSKHTKELEELEVDLKDHKIIREVYQQASVSTQTYLERHISSIVTNALRSVFFENDIEFIAQFNKKRNGTECKLTILEDGDEYDIIDDKGFGVADIASFALRVAYVLLDSTDKVLILDEPFRNLDRDRAPYASKMVKELSTKLGIQFIICTHVEDLSEYADNIIYITKKRKQSNVKQLSSMKSLNLKKEDTNAKVIRTFKG